MKTNLKLIFVFFVFILKSQNVGINSTGAPPSGDAGLDIDFTNKGLLIPRVSLGSTTTYGLTGGGPTTSMLVYNNNSSITGTGAFGSGFYFWNGTRWAKLLSLNNPSDAWLTIGNSGTTPGTHFLGTTDPVDFILRTNNFDRMYFTSNGRVGIATSNPQNTLTIGPNPTPPYNLNELLQIAKTGDAYLTVRDGTATALIGTTGGLPFVGSQSNHDIVFRTNNLEKARLTASGNFAIGTNAPIVKFHVQGTHPLSGPGTGANSDAPTEAIIPASSNGTSRFNDWPNGWGGGLSTWDICGASTYFSAYLTRSDRSFKKDIKPINFNEEFVKKFMELNPVTYNFDRESLMANNWDYNRIHYGFIANEVEKIFPDLVVNADLSNVRKGLEYDAFIPMLVKFVQEQQKDIQKLKAENENLKKEIQRIKESK